MFLVLLDRRLLRLLGVVLVVLSCCKVQSIQKVVRGDSDFLVASFGRVR